MAREKHRYADWFKAMNLKVRFRLPGNTAP